MGYFDPVGGYVKPISKDIAVHGCPFSKTTIPLGSTSVAIKLEAPGNPIIVTNPTIYCPETEQMLELISPDATPNVKYLAALNQQHYMGLKSWIEKYPDAEVIGVEGLQEKTSKDHIHFDYLFTTNAITPESVRMPKVLIDAFDIVYYPTGIFREILLLHKATKTLLTADLLFNLPAKDQYHEYWQQDATPSWYSYVYAILQVPLHYFHIDSYITIKVAQLATKRGTSFENIERVHNWQVDRIIACHGDIVEGERAQAVMTAVFGPLVSKGR